MEKDTKETIGDLIREMENNYTTGETVISKYVTFNQYENINKIDAYYDSKHISGDVDSMGREKPFFNIVISGVNIWYRATDIDRQNIKLKSTNSKNAIATFFANVHIQEWMKKIQFGKFLNDWGRMLAKYGSAVTKFVEQDGTLKATVPSWNRIICDTVDFRNNPVIEKLYLTPAQLKNNPSYDQDQVKSLLDTLTARKTLDKQQKDNKNDYIEVYEIHGQLPLSHITEKESDQDIYVQQMHVISFVGKKEKGKKVEFTDFTLYKGREKKNPYMITHLIEEDGRTQAKGAVEYLFDAQWMQNHTAKQIKDQLDLASKLIFQTADPEFVGKNVLTNIENGDILIHELNSPLESVGNNSHDITSLQNFGQQWKVLASEIIGVSESMRGENPPSGTAWHQTEALLTESHSLFELMTENKGLYLEDMMREYVIPFVRKQFKNKDEIMATLSNYDITKIDSIYVKNEAIKRHNAKIIEDTLNEKLSTGIDIPAEMQKIQSELSQYGTSRPLAPDEISWEEEFKDVDFDAVEVEITAEQSNKQSALATLSTVFQTIANPATAPVLNNPLGKMLFSKILQITGEVSPLEIAQFDSASATQPVPSPAPQQQQQPVQNLNGVQ